MTQIDLLSGSRFRSVTGSKRMYHSGDLLWLEYPFVVVARCPVQPLRKSKEANPRIHFDRDFMFSGFAQRKGQRRKPATHGRRNATRRAGWLPFAGPSWLGGWFLLSPLPEMLNSKECYQCDGGTYEAKDPAKHKQGAVHGNTIIHQVTVRPSASHRYR
jgi:hypothetical protein